MRFIFAALIAIGINGMSYGQIEISTAILDIPDYHEKLNKLVSQQIIGYRVNTEFKTWDPFKPEDTKPWQVGHRVAVHGKEQWVSRNTIPLPSGDGKDYYVHVLSPDSCYYLQIKPGGNKYSVLGHDTAWGNRQSYGNSVHLFSACAQLFQPGDVKEVLETTNDEYEGKPTKRITVQTKYGAKLFAHVNRETFQHIYSECDKVMDFKTRGYVEGKRIQKTEYRDVRGQTLADPS